MPPVRTVAPPAAGAPADAGVPGSRGRILFVVNASWNVVNFRLGLIRRLMDEGYAVTVAAPRDAHSAAIEAAGCRYVDLPMQPHGRSPLADLGLLARFARVFAAERPDFYLGYTAKPNIYGSIAAAAFGVPAINNIAGLGTVFNEAGWTNRIIKRLYRLGLRRSARTFFQNREDMAMFVAGGIARADRADLLPGSGVDLTRFRPAAPRDRDGPFIFLLVARLLWDKGVRELIDAARRLRAEGRAIEVRLLGFVEAGKPSFVQQADLDAWTSEGIVTYLGTTADVRPHLAAADCVVLPSYYPEGTPRALLEAAAIARPVITCDMPGCRDVVVDGENGYLVPPRDPDALADAMRRMTELAPDALAAMGRASRARAEAVFDERLILDRYVAALRIIAERRG